MKKIIGIIVIVPFLPLVVIGFICRFSMGAFQTGQEYASDFSKWLGSSK